MNLQKVVLVISEAHWLYWVWFFHKESIQRADELAKRENLNNVKFEVSSASEFPGNDYDFVTFFDCLHDMGDPQSALTHTKNVIKKDDGVCMIVEPFA